MRMWREVIKGVMGRRQVGLWANEMKYFTRRQSSAMEVYYMTSQQSRSRYHSDLIQRDFLWMPFHRKLLFFYVAPSKNRTLILLSCFITTDAALSICHLRWVAMMLGEVWNQDEQTWFGDGHQILNLSFKAYHTGVRKTVFFFTEVVQELRYGPVTIEDVGWLTFVTDNSTKPNFSVYSL